MIVVFGANGMLGSYVSSYLTSQNYKVVNVTRADLDVSDFSSYNKLEELLEGATAVINCAGTIKPVAKTQAESTTFMVNSVFPNYLARLCYKMEIRCYHITTDCVYSGESGYYDEACLSDVFDDYGFSKSLGDYASQFCSVIRTSIIGEELYNKRSLVEWAKSQKDKEVNGYIDHIWNGVTCLQLAKIIDSLLKQPYETGIFHYYSNAVTKAELLQLISDAFKLNLKIKVVESGKACIRILTSRSIVNLPSLKEQIEELSGYYK